MICPKTQYSTLPFMRRYCLLMLACLSLIACSSNEHSDLKAWVQEVKSRQKGAIAPLPEVKTVATFAFDPDGLRNPFELSKDPEKAAEIKVSNGIQPDLMRHKQELETYSLDSLRMVGTVNLKGTVWGLVRANDGTIHRVKNGNYLGQNHGRVIQIMDERINLMEILPDGPAAWRERQASLALAE